MIRKIKGKWKKGKGKNDVKGKNKKGKEMAMKKIEGTRK